MSSRKSNNNNRDSYYQADNKEHIINSKRVPKQSQAHNIATEEIINKKKTVKTTSKNVTSKHNTSQNNYSNDIIAEIAEMFIDGDSIKDIQNHLLKNVGKKYRSALKLGSPDSECRLAKESSGKRKDSAVKDYKYTNERSDIQKKSIQRRFKSTITSEKGRPFAFVEDGVKLPLKQPIGRGDCGDCWLCGLKVYFYFDKAAYTGCGDCEHIGGITASLLAGMLSKSMTNEMAYNYGTAHVHCNQFKKDHISMKYDNENDRWIYDNQGTNKIVEAILGKNKPNKIHSNEYDPEFVKNFKTLDKKNMTKRIENYTKNVWCPHANEIIEKVKKSKIDIAKRTITIIKSIIDNTNYHSNSIDEEDDEDEDESEEEEAEEDDENEDEDEDEDQDEDEEYINNIKKKDDDSYNGGTLMKTNDYHANKYISDETFGIKIENNEQAQEMLDELRNEQNKEIFLELLNNLIIALHELVEKKRSSPHHNSVKKSPKKIQNNNEIRNFLTNPETSQILTQYLEPQEIKNFIQANKSSKGGKTRSKSKSGLKSKTRKQNRK
jgi:hypothetical protein